MVTTNRIRYERDQLMATPSKSTTSRKPVSSERCESSDEDDQSTTGSEVSAPKRKPVSSERCVSSESEDNQSTTGSKVPAPKGKPFQKKPVTSQSVTKPTKVVKPSTGSRPVYDQLRKITKKGLRGGQM